MKKQSVLISLIVVGVILVSGCIQQTEYKVYISEDNLELVSIGWDTTSVGMNEAKALVSINSNKQIESMKCYLHTGPESGGHMYDMGVEKIIKSTGNHVFWSNVMPANISYKACVCCLVDPYEPIPNELAYKSVCSNELILRKNNEKRE